MKMNLGQDMRRGTRMTLPNLKKRNRTEDKRKHHKINNASANAANAVPFQGFSLIGSIRASGSDCTNYSEALACEARAAEHHG